MRERFAGGYGVWWVKRGADGEDAVDSEAQKDRKVHGSHDWLPFTLYGW